MKNKKLLCSVCFLFTFMSVLWGQNITVKGNVTSKTDGQPIIGASVVQNDSKSTGTITDLDGNFTLSVPANASLAISYIGYKEVIIAAKPSLKIVMEEDAKMIDEVVVTGYMAEKKASLTGSVAVVKMKEVADIPTGNVMSGLQGRVAGMNVTTDGKPGGGNTDTKLRGITTINNSSPLYVIDGVQTHDNVASIISSNDVESIQVLKDAASAAIYGAQAANGVIIITTKRAKEGDVKVVLICRSLPRLLPVVLICLTLTNGVMFIGKPIKILLEPIQTVLSMEMERKPNCKNIISTRME